MKHKFQASIFTICFEYSWHSDQMNLRIHLRHIFWRYMWYTAWFRLCEIVYLSNCYISCVTEKAHIFFYKKQKKHSQTNIETNENLLTRQLVHTSSSTPSFSLTLLLIKFIRSSFSSWYLSWNSCFAFAKSLVMVSSKTRPTHWWRWELLENIATNKL